MENMNDSEANAKISEPDAYSKSCSSNSQSRGSYELHNMDDSETNAKISDSAYSNSCSNSQSRRSHSSKSTHSGSHSSGSSGYGGKPSTSGSSNTLAQPPKKDKEPKKKKSTVTETNVEASPPEEIIRLPEPEPIFVPPVEQPIAVIEPIPVTDKPEIAAEIIEKKASDHGSVKEIPNNSAMDFVSSPPYSSYGSEGFTCVISMHDGVVMYTTVSITTVLGYPQEMWNGRSFIEFVHPRDQSTFALQITNGLALPKFGNITHEKIRVESTTMVCRIRRHRNLIISFGTRERLAAFMPFHLKFFFKNISEDEDKVIYLVVQATPYFSAFRTSNEIVYKPSSFVIRHDANGKLEYIDPEAVPYLGYLQQDVQNTDVIQLYHPEDLPYLREVYESIVKQGNVSRSLPYRMMTQNGDYLKMETEWSSYINPWSMKLEFVIGKHYVIEGPRNPDVFQTPLPDANVRVTEDEKNNIHLLRENIKRIMKEVLTKPAEDAKLHNNKKSQELASFIESLIEEPSKLDEELRLEIHNPDLSSYERDSVMLGGISPHHDYDSKSSTETPVSYTQLNYNDNLQRYFDSHLQFTNKLNSIATGENVFEVKPHNPVSSNCLSPMDINTADSNASSGESNAIATITDSPGPPLGAYQHVRLTEFLLSKHNAEMEKVLVKMHRESRSSSKGQRERASNECRQKKKEHLARCNASFQPTSAGTPSSELYMKSHGVKRASKEGHGSNTRKHHCVSPHQLRRQSVIVPTVTPCSSASVVPLAPVPHWPTNSVNKFGYLDIGIPQHVPMLGSAMTPGNSAMQEMQGIQGMQELQGMQGMPGTSGMQGMQGTQGLHGMHGMLGMQSRAGMGPMHNMSSMLGMNGVYPMYYPPNQPPPSFQPQPNIQHFQNPMPYMMYGQPMYCQPFMYPAVPTPMNASHSMHPTSHIAQSLGLSNSNYVEACKTPLPPCQAAGCREKRRLEPQSSTPRAPLGGNCAGLQRSKEMAPDMPQTLADKFKLNRSSDEGTKTDGESSYSSFYSSFFRTESGSNDDSDQKRKSSSVNNSFWTKNNRLGDAMSFQSSTDGTSSCIQLEPNRVKTPRRKIQPPWMEQVSVTSELTYKYQVTSKSAKEVLEADKKKIKAMEQSPLVNDQLGQLYLDLQLQGVASRLTLEEGITSSSSSGEDNASVVQAKRKRAYSKLVMIYEENAPMPSPIPGSPENNDVDVSSPTT